MVSIPGGLVNFTNSIFATIESLDGLGEAVGDPIASATSRVTSQLAPKISGPSSFFQDTPDFVAEAVQTSVDKINLSSIPSIQADQQILKQYEAGKIGQGSVQLGAPQDTTALSQIFGLSKASCTQSLFQDPMQSFLQVGLVNNELADTLKGMQELMDRACENANNLLILQPQLDYNQLGQLDPNYFNTGSQKANAVFDQLQIVSKAFVSTGQIDPFQRNILCTLIDDAISYFALANTKFIEFERARAQFESDLNFVKKKFESFKTGASTLQNYIPTFVASIAVGKIFRAATDSILGNANLTMDDLIKDIAFVQSLQGKRREKALAIIRYTQTFAALKAFLCTEGASESYSTGSNPDPTVTGLETQVAAIGTELASVAMEATIDTINSMIPDLIDGTKLATIVDNSVSLAASLASFITLCGTMDAQIATLLAPTSSLNAYKESYNAVAEADPTVSSGPDQVLNKAGFDGIKSQLKKSDFDSYLDFNVTNASTLGQFSDALSAEIKTLPDGPEKDQLLAVKELIDGVLYGVNESLEFDRLDRVAFDERVELLAKVQDEVQDTLSRVVDLPPNIEDFFNG